MRYLVDTHILLWSFEGTRKISKSVSTILQDTAATIFFSPVSLWEISIKYQLGKLAIHGVTPEEFLDELNASFFEPLPLDTAVITSSYHLPRLHGDPFDRLLIWQAIQAECTLLSADAATDQYQPHGLTVIH